MGLRGSGVQVVQGVRGLRGLAEAKLKKSFYKTFLKLPKRAFNLLQGVNRGPSPSLYIIGGHSLG